MIERRSQGSSYHSLASTSTSTVPGQAPRFRIRSVRWFVRQYVRAVLQSESHVEVDSWVTKTALALMKQSKQRRGDFSSGLSEWAEANPVLLCQLAGCLAASTTARMTGSAPTLFHTSMQSAAASHMAPELAA